MFSEDPMLFTTCRINQEPIDRRYSEPTWIRRCQGIVSYRGALESPLSEPPDRLVVTAFQFRVGNKIKELSVPQGLYLLRFGHAAMCDCEAAGRRFEVPHERVLESR